MELHPESVHVFVHNVLNIDTATYISICLFIDWTGVRCRLNHQMVFDFNSYNVSLWRLIQKVLQQCL